MMHVEHIQRTLPLFDELIENGLDYNYDFGDIYLRRGRELGNSLFACSKFINSLYASLQENQLRAVKGVYKKDRDSLFAKLILLFCCHPRIMGVTEPVTLDELECLLYGNHGCSRRMFNPKQYMIPETRLLNLQDPEAQEVLKRISLHFKRSAEIASSIRQKGFWKAGSANIIDLNELGSLRELVGGNAEQELLLQVPHIHSAKGKSFLERIKRCPEKEWHADFDPTEDYLKFLRLINLGQGKVRCKIESPYLQIVCLDLLASEEDQKFIEDIASNLKNKCPDGKIVVNPDAIPKRYREELNKSRNTLCFQTQRSSEEFLKYIKETQPEKGQYWQEILNSVADPNTGFFSLDLEFTCFTKDPNDDPLEPSEPFADYVYMHGLPTVSFGNNKDSDFYQAAQDILEEMAQKKKEGWYSLYLKDSLGYDLFGTNEEGQRYYCKPLLNVIMLPYQYNVGDAITLIKQEGGCRVEIKNNRYG